MPIGTAHTGKGARGVLDYALGKDKTICQPEIIGGSMAGETARDLAAEFGATRRLRPDIAKPVHHLTLSGCPNEEIGDEKWLLIAERHLANLGYGVKQTQYVVIRHHDTDREHWSRQTKSGREVVYERPADDTGWKCHEPKEHIHIIISRIQFNERLFRNSNDRYKVMASCRDLEKHFDLERGTAEVEEPSKNRPNAPSVGDRIPTPRERKVQEKTGAVPRRIRLQQHIKTAADGRPDLQKFVLRLEEIGIKIHPNFGRGVCNGVAYSFEGERFKGQDLGERFKWAKLQKEFGVSYVPERDNEFLEQRRTNRVIAVELSAPKNVRNVKPVAITDEWLDGLKRRKTMTRLHALLRKTKNEQTGFTEYFLGAKLAVVDSGPSLAVMNGDDATLIGLEMATRKYGTALTAVGSDEWKERVARIAARNGVDVQFADRNMQRAKELEQLKVQFCKLQEEFSDPSVMSQKVQNRQTAEYLLELAYDGARGKSLLPDLEQNIAPNKSRKTNIKGLFELELARSEDGQLNYTVSALSNRAPLMHLLKTAEGRAQKQLQKPVIKVKVVTRPSKERQGISRD